jgi:hypothetical protein
MADPVNKWKFGRLHLIDELEHGDPQLGKALEVYAHTNNVDKQSRQWKRTITWMENIFFGLGRHYVDDLLASRLTADSSGDNLRIAKEVTRNIPRPTNDLLGRYIETNISLLTENRPRPRVTAKSDSRDDKMAAELSELTMEYLWEKLDLPEKHRNLARLCLYTGTAWLEVIYDPLQPRYVTIPQMEEVPETISPEGKPIRLPTTRRVPKVEGGRAQYATGIQYGDITASIISGFEMHLPTVHYWNGPEMAWIMRETYIPVELLKDKYGGSRNTKKTTKQNGWFLDSLDKTVGENIHNLPLWWWERMSDMVEGPGPSLYVGTSYSTTPPRKSEPELTTLDGLPDGTHTSVTSGSRSPGPSTLDPWCRSCFRSSSG